MLALLQLDSVSEPLVERMLEEGRLPNLAALADGRRWEPLEPAAPMFQSATYPTLYTGISLADHGLYTSFPWSAADQRAEFMHRLPTPPTIWDRLTAVGRRSLVVDPYHVWAPDRIDGVFLSGWQFVDRIVLKRRWVPRRRGRALTRRHGRPPNLSDVYGTPRAATLLAWRDQLVRAPKRVALTVRDLLAEERFDLVWINFGASHKAGHHLWDPVAMIDEELDADEERTLRAGLEDVYIAVDDALGAVVDALPSGTELIVFSPNGMGSNTSAADLLPGMLDGILSDGERGGDSEDRNGIGSPIWALRARVPVGLRDRLARSLPDRLVADMTTRLYVKADWGRTRAMAVPGENTGYVRLNLRGREREGVVDPDSADELMDEIAAGLLTFRDPDGSPIVGDVERARDLVGVGRRADLLPDLAVSWEDRPAVGIGAVSSEEYGRVERRGVGSGRSGHHTETAWALVLASGSRRRDDATPARIEDIGATACDLLGADSTGLGGKSLLEAR